MTKDVFTAYSYLLDRTARKVKQFAQRQFTASSYDITVDQWIIIKRLHEENDLTQSQLGELVGKDNPTVTRMIDLLCKKGLTERRQHPTDRRCYTVHLTEAGEQRVQDWSPKMTEIRMKAWENLNENDFVSLKRILDTIYNNLNDESKTS